MKGRTLIELQDKDGRLVEYKAPERPVFNIGNETNLQAALAEATTEIDLSAINASLNYQNIHDYFYFSFRIRYFISAIRQSSSVSISCTCISSITRGSVLSIIILRSFKKRAASRQ